MNRWRLGVVSAAVGVAATVLPALTSASAAYAFPAGSVGHDVSYPQCSYSGATTTTIGGLGGSFGIVGVTGGRPWGPNSCSGAEFSWASALPQAPGLYMNTANPAPTSSYYWPTSGTSDPALCSNSASKTDPGCAYDYGWHAAADAVNKEAAAIANASSFTWWLDVETANSWNGDGPSNAADLQGSVDYLRSHGVPAAGIYSTSAQWSSITGGYSATNASTYAADWAPEFTAQYPMTGSPVWVAGLGTSSNASSNCNSSFTGGPVWLAQYSDGSGYDADLACTVANASPSLSFTPASESLTAGAPSAAMQVNLSTPAPAGGLSVSVATSSAAGSFSTTSTGPFAAGPIQLTVQAGTATSPAFYYEDTKAGSPVLTASSSGWTSATQNDSVGAAALSSISVSPGSSSVAAGGTDPVTASGFDAYGNQVSGLNPTWSDSLGGTFSPATGSATTFSAPGGVTGQDTLSATQNGIVGTTTVTVTTQPTIAVSVTQAGSTFTKKRTYQTPARITATSNPGGTAVGAASVSWQAFTGACGATTGSAVSSGSGTTSRSGAYQFNLVTRAKGSFCVEATVSASGYASGSGSGTISVT